MTKISSFNVNSINSRLHIIAKWLAEENQDIVMLQELKCTEEKFPKEIIEELGYNFVLKGQKTFNGVAILSKTPIENLSLHFEQDPKPDQARFISADTYIKNKLVKIINVYVPNGGEVNSDKFEYKLRFLDGLYEYLSSLDLNEMPLFIGGDFNVALTPMDVYDHNSLDGTTCYHHHERIRIRKIISLGLFDLFRTFNPDTIAFSWWDYRGGAFHHNKGMRIDYLIANDLGASMCKNVVNKHTLRSAEKASDHVPVVAELKE